MSAQMTRVLLLEDNAGDFRLVQASLADAAPGSFVLTHSGCLADALARLDTGRFEVMLSDLTLPDSDRLSTVKAIVAHAPALPLVVLTGLNDDALGEAAILQGAQDYLVKSDASGPLIARTLHYAIERKGLERELRQTNAMLELRVAERTAELQTMLARLNESLSSARALADTASDAIITSDQEGAMQSWNRAAERMFGYSEAEALGQPLTLLMPERYRSLHMTAMKQTQEGDRCHGLEAPVEVHGLTKAGREFPLELSLSSWTSASGKMFAGIIRDITERKRAEEARFQLEAQLRESQKMDALGTLAGGVAHDFNNALTAILGNVELARQDVGNAHPALESLDEIAKASRRAKNLVQQILAFGRRQVLERKVISLAPVVEESARLLRTTLPAGIILDVACAPDAPAVLADAIQIEQVLLNLGTNAWHALHGRERAGTIEIRLQAQVCSGRHFACLTVRDNGSGMDEATRARVFEPFFTTKQVDEGTGLGLSVVHGIVKDHGASIEVRSTPGEGSRFVIQFPAAQAAAAPEADAHAPDGGSGETLVLRAEGKRVLYIDDDESIVLLMTRLLQRQGYRVSGYTDAREALAAVQADPDQFDLAVTDYNMPGMSGLEVAQELRQIRADLPVALASGYITEELRAKAPAAGVRELIYKPNTVSELCEVVARLAAGHSGTSA